MTEPNKLHSLLSKFEVRTNAKRKTNVRVVDDHGRLATGRAEAQHVTHHVTLPILNLTRIMRSQCLVLWPDSTKNDSRILSRFDTPNAASE